MRYIVGIDLGTTNSCVAYVDTQDPRLSVKSFKIPQLTSPGVTEALSVLPSFCYLPSQNEFSTTSLKLPWSPKESHPHFFVGSFAKKQGAKVPTRLVQSAKSWLCHSGANRRDKILPSEAADEASRISPLEATMRYLSHIKSAWNDVMAKADEEASFDNQEIILTVPASFDEVARSLTVEAAKQAGFNHLTLIEEPQSAFYSWIAQHENVWEKQLVGGQQILICDVGGGTTDFSLIEVVETESGLSFRRMAVGDHLLLGGDNMDAALTHFIEEKMHAKGHELSNSQRQQLFHEARAAKEELLSSEESHYRIVLHGEGSSVVKGTLSTDLNREEVQNLLLNGFFGEYSWEEALKLKKTSGFRSMGLPYENEPSVSKHLAHFLAESGSDRKTPAKPDFILFNGGTMTPKLFQQAIVSNLNTWFPDKKISILDSYNLDLAVARGAAYFGKARRGLGVKIGGGLARGYYLILDTVRSDGTSEKKAMTLMPRGSEEGEINEPDTTFVLTPNTPVSFQLACSHVRLNDAAGDLVPIDPEDMHLLPPINTVLRFGKKQDEQSKIPVHLLIKLTPIGTLEIGLKSLKTDHRWALEFQLKSATGSDSQVAPPQPSVDQTFDASYLDGARKLLIQVFSSEKTNIKLSQLSEKLEEILAMPRKEWPPSVLRGLSDIILKQGAFRKVSSEHIARWWNLTGFLLRPGFGFALDDFRIKELWKYVLNDFKSQLSPDQQIQLWICYRRISGGLSRGQQTLLANDLVSRLFNKRSGKIEVDKNELYAYSEKIRALASMELLETSLKIRLGNALAARISSGNSTAVDCWALGRIGARHLVYGSLVNVIPVNICEEWSDQILEASVKDEAHLVFTLEQLARKTEHKELNVSTKTVEKILTKFADTPHSQHLQDHLLKECRLTQKEKDQIFGEHLPAGLQLEI